MSVKPRHVARAAFCFSLGLLFGAELTARYWLRHYRRLQQFRFRSLEEVRRTG